MILSIISSSINEKNIYHHRRQFGIRLSMRKKYRIRKHSENAKSTSEKTAKILAPALARVIGLYSSSEKSGKLLAKMMTAASFEEVSGKYFDREKQIPSSELSYNKANAANLWERSTELTRLQQEETIFNISS